MNVNTQDVNPALQSLFEDSQQVIFLDANFFITPDRSRMGAKPIVFSKYKEYWLDPLFDAFSNLSIHETVYGELVDSTVKNFADEKISQKPSKLKVCEDSELTEGERNCLSLQIQKMAPDSADMVSMFEYRATNRTSG